jgi:hypothetical protein
MSESIFCRKADAIRNSGLRTKRLFMTLSRVRGA